MKTQSVFDDAFRTYGRVVDGYDYKLLLERLEAGTPKPADSVVYVPSVAELGYCNGTNTKLNCFEYHRDSEIDIAADDAILLVARQQDIVDGKIDSSRTEAFLCPKGTGVELYATTLHYAPCSAKKGEGFRVVIVLPKGTNEDAPEITVANDNDKYLWARNKWLIAHPDSAEAADGAQVGITGDNIDIIDLI